eukprot:4991398-Karenia_brevis.AAC.1
MMGLRFIRPTTEIGSLRHVVLFHMILMKCRPVLVLDWARMNYPGASILTMLRLRADFFSIGKRIKAVQQGRLVRMAAEATKMLHDVRECYVQGCLPTLDR